MSYSITARPASTAIYTATAGPLADMPDGDFCRICVSMGARHSNAMSYQGTSGTASASFPGSRTLVTTGLTGTYKISHSWELEPSARVFALWEKGKSYTDSLGTDEAGLNFFTGRASAGAKLTYHWKLSSTATIAPYAGLYADYYF